MILHPDGRVEGSPEELAAYRREQEIAAQLDEPAENLLLYGGPTKPEDTPIWGNASTDDVIPAKKRRILTRQPYPLTALRITEHEDIWRGFDGRFKTL